MRLYRLIVLLCFTLAVAGVQAKGKNKAPLNAYVYGFAMSFNDSTVYFTNVSELKGATIQPRTKFLNSREQYSYQLRQYLQENGVQYPTCIISFASTRQKAEKKYAKMHKRYTKIPGQFTVKYITDSDFQFTPIILDDEENAAE